jgi:hypothetical protein
MPSGSRAARRCQRPGDADRGHERMAADLRRVGRPSRWRWLGVPWMRGKATSPGRCRGLPEEQPGQRSSRSLPRSSTLQRRDRSAAGRAPSRRRGPAATSSGRAAAARAPSNRSSGGCDGRAPGSAPNCRRSRPRLAVAVLVLPVAVPVGWWVAGLLAAGGRVGSSPGRAVLRHPALGHRAPPGPVGVQVGLLLAVDQPLRQPRRWRVRVKAGAAVGDHLVQRAAPPLARAGLPRG